MKKLLYNKKLLLSLFDSYKPLIAAMAFLIISISSSAQYYDSTKILQAQQSYGFSWKNGKFYNLQIPQDTATKYKVADSNYISIKNGTIYVWNGYAYVTTSSSSGTVSNFTAGDLSPLFTSSVVNPTTTPALTFGLSNTSQYKIFGRKASGSGAPSYLDADSSLITALHSEDYYNTKYLGVGATLPYWSLASGGALTGNNDITGSHSLTFTDQTSFNVVKSSVGRLSIGNTTTQLYGPSLGAGLIFSSSSAAISGNLYTDISGGASSGRTSSMRLTADEATINPSLGVLVIDSLATSSSPTHLMTWIETAGANRGKTQVLAMGTGVSTALGINTGSAGAFLTFNGNAGTPSALVGTNITGLPLTTGVTGLLPIANGGTNNASLSVTAGTVYFGDGSKMTGDNANFFWDNSNKRLGIGTASPSQKLHSQGSGTTALFKSTGYSSSTVIIEDPDGTTYLTNGQFKVNTVPLILNANGSYLSLQTAGVERINIANAGDITLKGATILATPVTTGIDLSGGSYNADDAGLYDITKGDVTNSFSLPDATTKTGKTIKVIVKVGESAPIIAAAGVVYDKLGAVLSTISGGTYTFTSNGADWWEF